MQNYHNAVYPRPILRRAALPRAATAVFAPGARLAMGLILLVALAFRLWGLPFGLPYVIQPDEPSVEMRALHMWLAGDANPHYFVYPSLYYDMQALWAAAVGHVAGAFYPDVLRHPYLHLPVFYLAGRALTALIGSCTVFVTYLIGRALAPRLGLFAALFLAVAPEHVQQSHFITVDAPTALFTALAALFALRLLSDAAMPRDALLAGIAAGLAAGAKYNAGVALTLPVCAALLNATRPWTWRFAAALSAVAVCMATFVLTTPFALLDRGSFMQALQVVQRHYATGHPGAEGHDNALWYLLYLAREGTLAPIAALAVGGIAVLALHWRTRGYVLLAFTLPYYALLSSTYVRFERNLLPLFPFIALSAAAAAYALLPHLILVIRNHAAAVVALLVVTTVPCAYAAARADYTITHPFTEEVAVRWASTHLAAGATIATENWEGRPFERLTGRNHIINVGALGWRSYAWLKAQHVRYVVLDAWTDDAYLHAPRRYPVEAARYRAIYNHARVLTRITGNQVYRPGPDMTIFELP